MKKITKIAIVSILSIIVLMSSVGCSKKEDKKIVIAEQFGLAYAPIQIMKEMNYLQELLPEYEIEWVKLGNTAAIREAVLADKLDVGFLGIPPFLIGYDNDMPWKIFTGLSSAPLGLVSSSDEIQSLKDITDLDRIILPQPGSIQHILLSMAAENEFGDAKYFDKQLATMKHPEGMQLLLAGSELKLHFTSPPYLFEELSDDSTHLVIDSESCFGGDFTFIVGMTTENLHNDTKAFLALNEALNKSIDFINDEPEKTLDVLKNYYKYEENLLQSYVYDQGIVYTSDITGVNKFIDFMKRNDYIKTEFTDDDVIW